MPPVMQVPRKIEGADSDFLEGQGCPSGGNICHEEKADGLKTAVTLAAGNDYLQPCTKSLVEDLELEKMGGSGGSSIAHIVLMPNHLMENLTDVASVFPWRQSLPLV